jgi:Uma2 family endonuclease
MNYYLLAHIEFAGLGRVYPALLDVELSYNNIVQPDVLVISNEHLDRDAGTRIIGTADLVVEIASPSTSRHDLGAKLNAYAQAGVPEYWVVAPGSQTVELLVLKDGAYDSYGLFSGSAVLPSTIVPSMTCTVQQFFSRPEIIPRPCKKERDDRWQPPPVIPLLLA